MTPAFVHLRLHSEFTVTDGIVRIDEAVARAAADGMPALAITDLANLFGMVKFYKAARAQGVKPHHRLRCLDQQRSRARQAVAPAAVVPQSHRAFCSCRELLTRAWLENQERGRAEIRKDWFARAGRRRPDRAFGRPGRRHRQRACAGQCRAGRAAGAGMGEAVSAALLYRAAARGRRIRRALCSARTRARRPARIAGGRDAPGAVPQAGGISRARGARVHRRGLRARRPAPAARVHAGELFQDARRKWRSCSPIFPRRSPTASRSRAAAISTLELGKSKLPPFPDAGGGGLEDYLRAAGRAGPRSCAWRSSFPTRSSARSASPSIARAWNSRSRPSPRWASPATS